LAKLKKEEDHTSSVSHGCHKRKKARTFKGPLIAGGKGKSRGPLVQAAEKFEWLGAALAKRRSRPVRIKRGLQ